MFRSQLASELLVRDHGRSIPGVAASNAAQFCPLILDSAEPSTSETMQTSFAFPFDQVGEDELRVIVTYFRAD